MESPSVSTQGAAGALSEPGEIEAKHRPQPSPQSWLITCLWLFPLLALSLVEIFFAPWLSAVLATDSAQSATIPQAVLRLPYSLFLIGLFWLWGMLTLGLSWKGQHKLASATFYSGLWLCTFIFLAENYLFQNFGRHLIGLWSYLRLPDGAQAAGNIGVWLFRGLGWAIKSAAIVGITYIAFRIAQKYISRLPNRLIYWLILGGILTNTLLLAFAWLFVPTLPRSHQAKVKFSLPIPVDLFQNRTNNEDAFSRLERALEGEYRAQFSYLYSPPRPGSQPSSEADITGLPQISIIVAESLRWTQLSEDLMPKLHAWSKRGLRAERHYAGSNHSEAGLFNLLYGRSALTYHSTLNSGQKPRLCEALGAMSYQCGYFTGHPKVWFRREEFLNPQTMSLFYHNDAGSWNEWDQRALKEAANYLNSPSPRLALTFLMSSHYEYQYPTEYAKHLPDTPPKTAWASQNIQPQEYVSSRNRYMNVAGFIDDIAANHISALDASNTIILFTADHGEETGEARRFGHGFGFSDWLTRVPFIVVGPGIKPQIIESLSAHQDILPTLLSHLGRPLSSQGIGLNLLAQPGRTQFLLAYAGPNQHEADALFLVGQYRLRMQLGLIEPSLTLIGFEDEKGMAIQASPTDAEIEALRLQFAEELSKTGQNYP